VDIGIDQSASNVARQWIQANVFSALATAAMEFAVFVLRRAFPASDPDIDQFTAIINFALSPLVLSPLSLVVFALLTGRVLERKLPAFPMRGWVLLHGLIGLAIGGTASFPFDSLLEALVKTGSVASTLVSVFPAVGLGIGITYGAAIGSAEALILRKVAHGLGLWISCSALAGICASLLTLAMLYVRDAITRSGMPPEAFINELLGEATEFVASVLAGFILLPAAQRLRPR
jgi:hypothetical protein